MGRQRRLTTVLAAAFGRSLARPAACESACGGRLLPLGQGSAAGTSCRCGGCACWSSCNALAAGEALFPGLRRQAAHSSLACTFRHSHSAAAEDAGSFEASAARSAAIETPHVARLAHAFTAVPAQSLSSATTAFSTSAAQPVQDAEAERRPTAGAALMPPQFPLRFRDAPQAKSPAKSGGRRRWQPQTEADVVARKITDRMEALLRAGQARRALQLFDRGIRATWMARAAMHDTALLAMAALADADGVMALLGEMQAAGIPAGYVAHGSVLSALCRAGRLQDALVHLDQRVNAGKATPAMCRTVAVAAMQAGDMLVADAALAADDACCNTSGTQRQPDTWAQYIRLQGMKGGTDAAEIAFTAAQLKCGALPLLHEAFVSALAAAGALAPALSALEDLLDLLPPRERRPGPLPAAFAEGRQLEGKGGGVDAAAQHAEPPQQQRSSPAGGSDSEATRAVSAGFAAGGGISSGGSSGQDGSSSSAWQHGIELLPDSPLLQSASATEQHQSSCFQSRRQGGISGVGQAAAHVARAAEAAGDAGSARAVIDLLLQAGHEVDAPIWNAALRAAVASDADPAQLDDLVEDMLIAGVPADGHTFAALADGYVRSGDMPRALALLENMADTGVEPNIYMFNALLRAAGSVGDINAVHDMYQRTAAAEVKPDQATFVALFQAVKMAGEHLTSLRPPPPPAAQPAAEPAWQLPSAKLAEAAVDLDPQRHMRLQQRQDLEVTLMQWVSDFQASGLRHSHATFTSLIQAHGRTTGSAQQLRLLKEEARKHDLWPQPAAYHAALAACARVCDTATSHKILVLMARRKVPLDSEAYASLIAACTFSANLGQAYALHAEAEGAGVQPSTSVQNALMRVHCHAGDTEGALRLLQRLPASGLQPDRGSWIVLLSAAKHANNVAFAAQVLALMSDGERRYWKEWDAWVDAAAAEPPQPLYASSDDEWGW